MTAPSRPRKTVEQVQAIRLKRLRYSTVSYVASFSVAAIVCYLGYLPFSVLMTYLGMVLVLNLFYFTAVATNLNLRFADPNMVMLQICMAIAIGYYVMYFAQHARGIFILLGVSAAMYGLYQFRTRDFFVMTAALAGGYVLLIVLLALNRPEELNVEVEVLQLIAFTACLLQFSGLGGHIVSLRAKVRQKNKEMEQRNAQLELALLRIEELAMRDELTGVYNRRHLMETIRVEKQRSKRTGSAFSICILDIDFFKQVNDTHGHLAGDEVLRQIAATASAALRQTDYFGRYGGEEFACVLTDTTAEGAMITADRIRASIEALRFPAMDPDLHVTVSIGVADCAQQEDTGNAFRRADEALYQAKQGGRNRCIAAPGAAALPGLAPGMSEQQQTEL
jgi:diguanylate cyclase (GGDEF)-like protein